MVHRNMEETSRVNGSMGLATSWRITLHETAREDQKGRTARGTRGAGQGIICRTIFCKAPAYACDDNAEICIPSLRIDYSKRLSVRPGAFVMMQHCWKLLGIPTSRKQLGR